LETGAGFANVEADNAIKGGQVEKIDYKKDLKRLYRASANKVEFVDVPKMNFLMIDGEGDPNGSQPFQDAVGILFQLSYTLKFMIKK